MSFSPNDLVTDADLLAYEGGILQQFGATGWKDKRSKALEDWIAPILKGRGFTLDRLKTRYEADKVWGYTGSTYTDFTSASKDTTVDDVNLATVFTTAGSDVLYLGSTVPFRGLSVRMADAVSAVSATLTVSYWADNWSALTLTDGTQKTTGKSFSGGGAITWKLPRDWVKRAVNASDPLYWVKVVMSATPTSAKAGQLGVIRRSHLCAPATMRTLTLILREAPTGGPGPWADKAKWYETEADAALARALDIIGGEFETDDPETGLVSADEADQTVAEVTGGTWRMERA